MTWELLRNADSHALPRTDSESVCGGAGILFSSSPCERPSPTTDLGEPRRLSGPPTADLPFFLPGQALCW